MKYNEMEIDSIDVENDQITKSPTRLVDLVTYSTKMQNEMAQDVRNLLQLYCYPT